MDEAIAGHPWWPGLRSVHLFEGCAPRRGSLRALSERGIVDRGAGLIDPLSQREAICGYCWRIWDAREANRDPTADPDRRGHHGLSARDRFMSKIKDKDGCWVWQGYCYKNGYGSFSVKRRRRLAHRVSYEMFVGSIPTGQCVLHRCDNPPCVNPGHLFLGDQGANMRDMAAKLRKWPVGPDAKHGRLSLVQVRDIRRRSGDGESGRSIASRHSVSPSTIYKILGGKQWADYV